MASPLLRADHLPEVIQKLLPSLGPVLLIAVSYVDPGKWAVTIDASARTGTNLLLLVICFIIAAIFYQYLAARIGLITRKHLAQICKDEYGKWTCMFLGARIMTSVIALDLTMILGIAHGLNLLLRMDLRTCICLTAVDIVLFPFLFALLEKHIVNILLSGFLVLLCFLEMFTGQVKGQPSKNGVSTLLKMGTTSTLMSLVGATIVPQNFFLHSSIVLQQHVVAETSLDRLCQHHLLAIFCVFGGIYLMNSCLINLASNVFHDSNLIGLTFPDALSQVFKGQVIPQPFLLILYVGNQILSLTWNVHGNLISRDLFGLNIPSWTIRIISIIPAFLCEGISGGEGIYQLLIFSEVVIAGLLPSSMTLLSRVASSQALMGDHKLSKLFMYLVNVSILLILGLQITLVAEIFGGYTNMTGGSYMVLFVSTYSCCLTVWLAVTSLKSETQVGGQAVNRDIYRSDPQPSEHREEISICDTRYKGDENIHEKEILTTEHHSENCSDIVVSEPASVLELPETNDIVVSEYERGLDLSKTEDKVISELELVLDLRETEDIVVSKPTLDIAVSESASEVVSESVFDLAVSELVSETMLDLPEIMKESHEHHSRTIEEDKCVDDFSYDPKEVVEPYWPYTRMLDIYVQGCSHRVINSTEILPSSISNLSYGVRGGTYWPYTKMLDAYLRGYSQRILNSSKRLRSSNSCLSYGVRGGSFWPYSQMLNDYVQDCRYNGMDYAKRQKIL